MTIRNRIHRLALNIRERILDFIPDWDVMSQLAYSWVLCEQPLPGDDFWTSRLMRLGIGIPSLWCSLSPQAAAIKVMHHSYVCDYVACRLPSHNGSCLHTAWTSSSALQRHCVSADEFKIMAITDPTSVSLTRASAELLVLFNITSQRDFHDIHGAIWQHPTIACSFFTEPPTTVLNIDILQGWSITVSNRNGVTVWDVHTAIVADLDRSLLVSELQAIIYHNIPMTGANFVRVREDNRILYFLQAYHTRRDFLKDFNWYWDRTVVQPGGNLRMIWKTQDDRS